ncbi:MAG: hypothetical protein ABEJ46_03365 [Gemmatimonadota bacterium]
MTAKDFGFEMPKEIASGWTTFRFTNTGEQEHFVYVYRLPTSVSYNQFQQEAMTAFGRVWNRYASGETTREEAMGEFAEELPGWFMTDLTPAGGVALTEPGETAESTVRLTPGTYVVECYVKTPKGTWHTERGMQRKMVVTNEDNGAPAPEADTEITLSSYRIEMSEPLSAGRQTIAVRTTDRPEGFMAHDLNLFRLEAEETVEEIVAWMDWMDLDQFRAPAPAYSLGGVEHLAPDRTGYMTVTLEPGRYAFVSEEYGSRGMVHEFTVQ